MALLALAAPVLLFVLAHREGMRRSDLTPSWVTAARPPEDEPAAIVTPLGVAEALAHLSVAPLTKAMSSGWQIAFDTPPMRVNNRGYQTVFSLPMGVTPDDGRRQAGRAGPQPAPGARWRCGRPRPKRPGFVDLWVADSGSAARPTPEYPLLHDGQADVFEGVPVGVAQRGDEIMFPVVGANFVAGGQMGQGKSNLCRVVMLGCATDPLADLWVHVFAGNGDFDAYRPAAGPLPAGRRRRHHLGRAAVAAGAVRGDRPAGGSAGRARREEGHPRARGQACRPAADHRPVLRMP
jgi:S-DNA-T family DNA segregation ATPase FtsK/SpoIIIE